MKMKQKAFKDWRLLLEVMPWDNRVRVTEDTKALADHAKQEYERLENKNDYIWVRTFKLVGGLLDQQLIKFLIILYRRQIISDLYLPLTVRIEKDGSTTMRMKKLFLNEEEAIAEATRNPQQFPKNFIRFKIKNWQKFSEVSKTVNGQLTTQHEIMFDKMSGKITYAGKECQLPFKKVEHYIAQALFERPPETKLSEDNLMEYFDAETAKADSPSRIYDAVRRINVRAYRDLDIEKLIFYGGSNYWRRKMP